MSANVLLLKSFIFTFFKWTIKLEKFNKKVKIPTTYFGFVCVKENEICISCGHWLMTILLI